MECSGIRKLTVMYSMVTGRVEDPLDGTQFPDQGSMKPKLVHQIELVVDQEHHRWHT